MSGHCIPSGMAGLQGRRCHERDAFDFMGLRCHVLERVLPHVPYRQWTLSFPHRVRWGLLKKKGLLSDVLSLFLRAVFALQRRRARRQGVRGGQTGAASFLPFFGSKRHVESGQHFCSFASRLGHRLRKDEFIGGLPRLGELIVRAISVGILRLPVNHRLLEGRSLQRSKKSLASLVTGTYGTRNARCGGRLKGAGVPDGTRRGARPLGASGTPHAAPRNSPRRRGPHAQAPCRAPEGSAA